MLHKILLPLFLFLLFASTLCANNVPTTSDDIVGTIQDTPVEIDVLANDFDSDGNLVPSSVTLTTMPPVNEGIATVNAVTGIVTFTPAPGFTDITTPFIYEVCDDGTPSLCNTATIIVVVDACNDPLIPADDTEMTLEDVPVTINVIANDPTDPNSATFCSDPYDPNTITIASLPLATIGTATVIGNGEILFTPAPNFNGVAEFTYQICDNSLSTCDVATVTVIIQPVNDAPMANDDNSSALNTPVVIDVLANDMDVDGNLDPMTLNIVSPPSNNQGTASVDLQTGMITFTPVANFLGTTFIYEVCDHDGACEQATVNISSPNAFNAAGIKPMFNMPSAPNVPVIPPNNGASGKGFNPFGFRMSASSSTVSLSPNPSKDKVTVEMTATSEEVLIVSIVSLTGKVLKQYNQNAHQGLNRFVLNLDTFSSGIYLVQIQGEQHQSMNKIVIKK